MILQYDPQPVLLAYVLLSSQHDIELPYVPGWIISGSNGTIDSFRGREMYPERQGLFDGVVPDLKQQI